MTDTLNEEFGGDMGYLYRANYDYEIPSKKENNGPKQTTNSISSSGQPDTVSCDAVHSKAHYLWAKLFYSNLNNLLVY